MLFVFTFNVDVFYKKCIEGEPVECENKEIPKYASVIRQKKKDNITTDNIGAIMLSQIPGVSAKVSEIIMNEYRTLFHLKESMKENNKCLNDLTYTLSNGQVRHINKKSIDNIFLFLHDNF